MEHGGRKMRLAAGEWPRFSCCQADKWAFCARRALNFSLFLTKTNFFKPVLPEPHHYKLPSARTHWSTPKYAPISLEQTLSETFRRVRAGTKPCVTERRDAGCVRAMRVTPATANP